MVKRQGMGPVTMSSVVLISPKKLAPIEGSLLRNLGYHPLNHRRTGSSAQCSVMTSMVGMGGGSKRERVYVYI